MSRRRARATGLPPEVRGRAVERRRHSCLGWVLGLAVLVVVIGVLGWAVSRTGPNPTAGTIGIPTPRGGPDVAQDVNTLIGKPAVAFTLPDADGTPYPVTPGQGKPTVLVFHMGIT